MSKEQAPKERSRVMPLGVVVERRKLNNPWQDYEWRPVAVMPGAPEGDEWKRLADGDGWERYLVKTLPLELHRKETEAYKTNLNNRRPAIYVVLETVDEPDAAHEVSARLVTASPYEAQDYLDSGETIVEGVPMPEGVLAWINDFTETHHVDEPFRKRKRKDYRTEDAGFSRPPASGNGKLRG